MQLKIPCDHRMPEAYLGHASNVQEVEGAGLSSYAAGATIGIMPCAGLVLPVPPGQD